MQENQPKIEFIPKVTASSTSIKSEINEKELPSGSTLLAIPSVYLCPKCKEFKAVTKINHEEATLEIPDEEEEEILRGTESTITIVAFPQNSQADDQKKYTFVSDVLNNLATEIRPIESIHELQPRNDENSVTNKPADHRRSTALEDALRSTDTRRLSYFEDEGFKMHDLKIVTSLTDLDTLEIEKDVEDSPRDSLTSQEPHKSMKLYDSKRPSWRSVKRSSGSFLSRISNAFRKSSQQ